MKAWPRACTTASAPGENARDIVMSNNPKTEIIPPGKHGDARDLLRSGRSVPVDPAAGTSAISNFVRRWKNRSYAKMIDSFTTAWEAETRLTRAVEDNVAAKVSLGATLDMLKDTATIHTFYRNEREAQLQASEANKNRATLDALKSKAELEAYRQSQNGQAASEGAPGTAPAGHMPDSEKEAMSRNDMRRAAAQMRADVEDDIEKMTKGKPESELSSARQEAIRELREGVAQEIRDMGLE